MYIVRVVTDDLGTGGRARAFHLDRIESSRSGRAEAMMRVVIQQPQSLRRDVMIIGLLLLLGLFTLAGLLLPGMVG